jgi:tRNA threonylcarbamoyladenosine biosynthesis protein TsaE
MHLDLRTDAAAATRRWGRALGRAARTLPPGGLVVALHGELGAGKTELVRGIAEGFGVDPARVASPTFVIAHEHPTPHGARLYHVDAYRLADADDAEASGFEEMGGEGRLTCVEWAERIVDALPDDRLDVEISATPAPASGTGRRIAVTARGPRARAVLARLVAGREATG